MKRLFYSLLTGLLSGLSASLFLISLTWITQFRTEHLNIVYGLPFAGFFIGWIYHRYGKDIRPGTNLIIDEIHDPQRIISFRMFPLIGGSAGREGTAIQMEASLADQLGHIFDLSKSDRRALLSRVSFSEWKLFMP